MEWLQTEPLETVERAARKLPKQTKCMNQPLWSLQAWCRVLSVPFRGKESGSVAERVIDAIRTRRSQDALMMKDNAQLLAWMQARPLEEVGEALKKLPLNRKDRHPHLGSLQDWCQVLGISFRLKEKEKLQLQVVDAIRNLQARDAVTVEENAALLISLQTDPFDELAETLIKLPRNRRSAR